MTVRDFPFSNCRLIFNTHHSVEALGLHPVGFTRFFVPAGETATNPLDDASLTSLPPRRVTADSDGSLMMPNSTLIKNFQMYLRSPSRLLHNCFSNIGIESASSGPYAVLLADAADGIATAGYGRGHRRRSEVRTYETSTPVPRSHHRNLHAPRRAIARPCFADLARGVADQRIHDLDARRRCRSDAMTHRPQCRQGTATGCVRMAGHGGACLRRTTTFPSASMPRS